MYGSALYRAPFQWIQSLHLLMMAYDHYVAICKLLHYLVIMRQKVCVELLVVSWVEGFLHSIIQLSTVYGLPFCGPNVTDHFTCDMYPY